MEILNPIQIKTKNTENLPSPVPEGMVVKEVRISEGHAVILYLHFYFELVFYNII